MSIIIDGKEAEFIRMDKDKVMLIIKKDEETALAFHSTFKRFDCYKYKDISDVFTDEGYRAGAVRIKVLSMYPFMCKLYFKKLVVDLNQYDLINFTYHKNKNLNHESIKVLNTLRNRLIKYLKEIKAHVDVKPLRFQYDHKDKKPVLTVYCDREESYVPITKCLFCEYNTNRRTSVRDKSYDPLKIKCVY